ncbi:hypothetical protein C8R46DRAFT_938835 [Mycena filopes]|nr:hypothetical protein C8R46DRAFT_1359383 [Mycena filopes]KAJ7184863.1 hypothetical protein C8R46DRAFT_938835 [Mycena filopes]
MPANATDPARSHDPEYPPCWNCGEVRARRRPTELVAAVELDHLLGSNDPPLEIDVGRIQDFLSAAQTRMDLITLEVSALEVAKDRLLSERQRIESQIRRHSAVLSPVRQLSYDIMSQIFLLTLPWTRRVATKEACVDQGPWRVAQICSRWRAYAFNCPQLWATISFSRVPASTLSSAYPLRMLEAHLTHTAHVPLEIKLEWPASAQGSFRHSTALIHTLVRHCARWERVCFSLEEKPQVLDTLFGGLGELALLRRLEIVHYSDSTPPPPFNPPEIEWFNSAPMLREVLLTGRHYAEASSALKLPWAQITHYRASASAWRHLGILWAAQNLVERRLCVMQSQFLYYIVAPVLQELWLEKDAASLLSFLGRSGCRLTSLNLSGCTAPAALIHILQQIPTLTHFCVSVAYMQDDQLEITLLLNALTLSGSPEDYLLPNLTSFWLGGYKGDLNPGHLQDMVESRTHTAVQVKLRSLRLFLLGPGRMQGPMTRLENLERAGILVYDIVDSKEAIADMTALRP